MIKFLDNKLFRYLSVFLFLNSLILPVKSSSALAAWAIKKNGVLELRTKSNTNLRAYFQKANQISGDRFWIDFPGELKNPRKIKGNGPIKEIRLGKPNKGKTRLVIEFKEETYLKPLTWQLVGLDQNRWRIKLFNPKYPFERIGEGLVEKKRVNIKANQNSIYKRKNDYEYLKLPEVKRNKFWVVIDPGHGGPDPGAIGIGGIRETDVVLEVSKIVKNLLSEKGVRVRLTRTNEVDLDLPPRVSIANNIDSDIFVSIHANASRGKRRDINGLETFYYRGWRGRLLAKKIQKQILKVSPGSPDRGVKQGRFYVIKNTRMPAVLVEIGFLTGRLDARRLEKITHRKRLAYAIAKGILEYLYIIG
ncbi:N-acetylmuramoyl-L-alanine amidase [Prochlorococcus marinus str. MIT 9321]|uniref:N-acetylmuramoyl-L-alanine amidase n=1 Tax=Prochlorococcus marinus str. MIT 9401 TaxID=167551 RepID=A0A0A2B3H6_PROMR|nr:N-acetylmuramoyl-L-alanine amidase [Prochlorococcus marinus]KGG03535.1 N-acetylmuramoyl-L-alanine amidase [Prochlorococcus marinus str. MIT 9321]KGG04676.1 N-acetylmuramoyl-L-alanine amidase [Prochlorococcus marinus str. MIT 9322]KGG07360.1 N-acetylmuramoyl-L-alanine amidase [Prochlorococcus marinus str. MIT 9401]